MNAFTPEAVVEKAFAAFRRRDGSALAALVAPESLEAYRQAVHADQPDGDELLRRAIRSVPDEAIALGHAVVLGHVRADNEAYVLFWLGTGIDGPIRFEQHPEIAALTLTEQGWRLLLEPYSPAGMPGFTNKSFVGPIVSLEPGDPSTEEA